MKDDDPLLPVTTSSSTTSSSLNKKDSSSADHHHHHNHNHNHNHNHAIIFGKNRYKFWALAAILLLAFWSMFTGTVTLRWSAGNLNRFSDDFDFQLHNDLDVLPPSLLNNAGVRLHTSEYPTSPYLAFCGSHYGTGEMEEREKVVKYMWDVYTNNRRIRLPRFWQQAFEAAYEDMTSDAVGVRENAVSEIAKMSVRSIDLDPPPLQLTGTRELSLKHAEIQKTATAGGNG